MFERSIILTDTQFVPPHSLKAAVLFLVFNRPDTTKQVFEAIRKAKPPRLYIAADGPRSDREGEADKVQAVRDDVINNIDWPCEVKTLLREKNLGCKYAVSGAITWFFENEEMGIILEDDCLPSQSFFWFCEKLLEKYKNHTKVWHIGGNNFQDGIRRGNNSYYFSVFNHVWGWAGWRRAWKYYDLELKGLPHFVKTNMIKDVFKNNIDQKYWLSCFQNTYNNKINTWDYQWTFTMWSNDGLAIYPNVNLVGNIGFGDDAVHTMDANHRYSNLPRFEMNKLTHPPYIVRDIRADDDNQKLIFRPKAFPVKVINKLKRMFLKR